MTSILNTNSEVNRTSNTQHTNEAETTGSLAMLDNSPIFNMPVVNYDMFIPTNPFSLNIDYGSYAEQENGTLASNSLFMQGFANAMSILSEGAGSYGAYSGSTVACVASGSCGGGSCSVGGGFTSIG